MRIQSQDIEKQRVQNDPGPAQARTPPRDRPPGQPHDPAPQSDQDNSVERTPTQDSPRGTQEHRRRHNPQTPS